jgi:hypothetical protein
MQQSNEQLPRGQLWLTFAGSVPFVSGAFFLALGIETLPGLGDVLPALSLYGLVIASFMAGAHWGQQLTTQEPWTVRLQAVSNLTAIGLWLLFVLASPSLVLLGLMLSFLLTLWVDRALLHAKLISQAYWRVRVAVTLVVVLALGVAWLSV